LPEELVCWQAKEILTFEAAMPPKPANYRRKSDQLPAKTPVLTILWSIIADGLDRRPKFPENSNVLIE